MRSLFAKILGWFVLTLVITLAATILIPALTYNPYSSPRPAPFSMLLTVEMVEARHAWETGGARSAHRIARPLSSARRGASNVILTDGNGTDLLTGEQHRGSDPRRAQLVAFPVFRPPRNYLREIFTRWPLLPVPDH